MANKLLNILPSNKLPYESLSELIHKGALYFVPIKDFTALLNKGLYNNEFEYIEVKKEKLLKLCYIRDDSNMVFKVSDSNYLINHKSNIYHCKENELTEGYFERMYSWKKQEKRYTEIVLSKEEYENYLLCADDYLVLFFEYERSIFDLFKKQSLRRKIYNFNEKFKDYKSIEGYFLYNVIVPLRILYDNYDNTVLKNYIYSILAILDDLFSLTDNISEVRLIDVTKNISDYLYKLIKTADTIPGAKISEIMPKTAEEVIKINNKKNSPEGNEHKYEKGNWSKDEADKLLDTIKARNELLEIYNL